MTHSSRTIITAIFVLIVICSFGQTNLSLKVEAQRVIAKLKKQNHYPTTGKDTLIDLNGDGYKDILIEFYSMAGTGLKNGISVYLFNSVKKRFESCEQLNHLANPTFYFDKNIVAGYYLANGGGTATKLKWQGTKLDTIEHIDIQVISKGNDISFKLTTSNYITKRETNITSEMMELPKEYKYMEYEPTIKSSSR